MLQNELISIVVPVYNAEPFLDNCISSLVKQSYTNIEIVLVDDESQDDSINILKKWELLDSRIKILSQNNMGASRARCNGVSLSLGTWITFVDADDVLPAKAIETLYKNSFDSDLVIGQVEHQSPFGWPYIIKEECLTSLQYLRKLLLDQIHSGPWARLFKRNLLTDDFVFDIPSTITHGEDTLMNYRIAGKCKKITLIPNIVYNYSYREISASRQNKFDLISYCNLYDKCAWQSLSKNARRTLWYVYLKMVFKRRDHWFRVKVVRFLRKLGLKK